MKFLTLFIPFLLLFTLVGCKKENDDPPPAAKQYGAVKLQMGYMVDQETLVYDTIRYQNAGGNKFSVKRLQYYLSDFRFLNVNGSDIHRNKVFYLDASGGYPSVIIDSIPEGSYQAFRFSIGLDPSNNISNGLPGTIENINMAWPDVMGGGYHFMKLEGHYITSTGSEKGFTVHIGTDPYLVNHNSLSTPFQVAQKETTALQMRMNINEWFTHPYDYDFNRDGNYTMGDSVTMKIIMNNGKDVFKIY